MKKILLLFFVLNAAVFAGGNVTDDLPPKVTEISLADNPSGYDTTITYNVIFDEPAYNVTMKDFAVSCISGTASGVITSASGSPGDTIRVTVAVIGTKGGSGTIRLELQDSTDITDGAGNGNGTNGYVTGFEDAEPHEVYLHYENTGYFDFLYHPADMPPDGFFQLNSTSIGDIFFPSLSQQYVNKDCLLKAKINPLDIFDIEENGTADIDYQIEVLVDSSDQFVMAVKLHGSMTMAANVVHEGNGFKADSIASMNFLDMTIDSSTIGNVNKLLIVFKLNLASEAVIYIFERQFKKMFYPEQVLPGAGSESDPYLIADAADLQFINSEPEAYYELVNDIDASGTAEWNGGKGFEPLGTETTPFTGVLQGNGYTVNGLSINRLDKDYVGLIGYTSGAEIKNVGLENVNIIGREVVGAIVGNASHTTVISECYSTGTVTGEKVVGGLVGTLQVDAGSITDSYSTCTVNATESAGGLIGINNTGCTIERSFSAGAVNCDNSAGGFAGSSAGTILNSFWDTETSGKSSDDGATGLTTVEMKSVSSFTNAGWDFVLETGNGSAEIWDIDIPNSIINNGYPFLSWQNGSDIALPVELSSFSVTSLGNDVKLKWQTVTETNNAGFSVERKSGKEEWTSIAFIEGAGNSTDHQLYSYTDSPGKGKFSYRLKQVDYDGSFSYSKVVEAETSVPEKFALEQNYPNPFNPSTTIAFSLPEKSNVKITVYNSIGQVVSVLADKPMEAGAQRLEWNAANYSSGIYYYKLDAEGIGSSVKKMILLK